VDPQAGSQGPNTDALRQLTSSADKRLRLWNLDTLAKQHFPAILRLAGVLRHRNCGQEDGKISLTR
jgi:hypothetical protein